MKATINITRWIVGTILCLASIAGFTGGDIALAIFSVLLGLLLLPPVAAMVTKKVNKPVVAVNHVPGNSTAPITGIKDSKNIQAQTLAGAFTDQQQQTDRKEPIIISAKMPAPAKKPGGIINWFKGWKTAVTTASALENCIKHFPNINAEKLNTLLRTKEKWSEKEAEFIRKRIIDKYDTRVNADTVELLGQQYLDFYKTIFPGLDGEEIIQKINEDKVEAFLFARVNDDEALDPTEIEEIIQYSKAMNVPALDSKEKIRKEYDYYITNWELDNGLFQGLTSDFMMDKKEVCIYKLDSCELIERKSVTRKVSYGGVSYRMKIAKGLSYRVGSYGVSSQKETVEISKGKGILNVTTKRIFFKGKEGVTTITTATIVDLEPFSDAVMIHKTTGKPITIKTTDGVKLYKYIRSAIRNK